MEADAGHELSLEKFRAELDVFSGPLDLLLHLIKQEEVDIFEVSVSRITERYLAAVRTMQFFDVNVAAEFLVVASTLTEIKSKTLLPPTPGEEEEEEEDAGAELVRRLLEYKEYKDAAGHLAERAEAHGEKFPRARVPTPGLEEEGEPPEVLLEDLAVWDLMAAFGEVIEQTQLRRPAEIVRSDMPVSAYIEEVLAVLRRAGGPVEFLEFFIHERSRARIVGIFLALLELVRRKELEVHQRDGRGCHFEVALRPAA
jgi:segregation and condensation protein A